MVDKGCDNCYYEYFGSRAYPCSLCIRGVKRTDKWQAKIHRTEWKCKVEHRPNGATWVHHCPNTDEPQTEVETMSCQECKHFHENAVMYLDQCDFCFKDCKYETKTEPQTERRG